MAKTPQKPSGKGPLDRAGEKGNSPKQDNKHSPSGKPDVVSSPAPKDHGTTKVPK